jgi:Asp-tRNA(Asn)/Glu-tRNA(Gln) amidotransferase A subunit family amidase
MAPASIITPTNASIVRRSQHQQAWAFFVNGSSRMASYSPRTFQPLSFYNSVAAFAQQEDTPRAYLERCLDTISQREPTVKAWVTLNEKGARAAADASTERYRAGRPLSPIDGMPIGIKDLIDTRDMPTQMGCEAYKNNSSGRDAPVVTAIRDAGGIVLGKTVTTELGMTHPGPTTNPFDPARTPGGSSSGSSAAIGACMVPAAIGSQVMGSVIRPASYCANVALKVTLGAIHRGDRQTLSQSALGVHAGNVFDCWAVARAIAGRTGGDPGKPGLYGPSSAPEERAPRRLIVMETEGWSIMDGSARDAFENVLRNLEQAGVTILRRGDHPLIETFEKSIAESKALTLGICAFENRFSLRHLRETAADKVSQRLLGRLAVGEGISLDTYRSLLQRREVARANHAALAHVADALIAPSAPGPAPVWSGDVPGAPLVAAPTGDVAFNVANSLLGSPAITVPIAAIHGLPFGVQIMGQPHDDYLITGFANWLLSHIAPVEIQ